MGLNDWIDAYKAQIDGLWHELAVAKDQLDQLRQSPRPSSKSQSTISHDIGSLADVRAGLVAVELARRIRGRVSRLFGRSERSRLFSDIALIASWMRRCPTACARFRAIASATMNFDIDRCSNINSPTPTSM